ncbi:hypothetical protein ACT7DH_10760 [Bacillus pacificus]
MENITKINYSIKREAGAKGIILAGGNWIKIISNNERTINICSQLDGIQ